MKIRALEIGDEYITLWRAGIVTAAECLLNWGKPTQPIAGDDDHEQVLQQDNEY